MKRIFFGITLSSELNKSILSYLQQIRYNSIFARYGIRFTPSTNLHVTVFFCGSIQEKYIAGIIKILKKPIQEIPPFTLNTSTVSFMPEDRASRMIWLNFQSNRYFSQLVQTIRHALLLYLTKESGQKVDLPQLKSILPHVTLARLKKPLPQGEFNLPPFPSHQKLLVKSVTLFTSKTLATGSVYTSLDTLYLKGSI